MIDIRPLTNCSIKKLHGAFLQAFADYSIPFQLQLHELEYMLHRRGFDPSLSYAAFVGDAPVAFTLNGTGQWNGHPTAYDTGTGTIPEYRRQGLAAAIFEATIPALQAAGICQYLLEVMQDNANAVALYRNTGFEVVRALDTYNLPGAGLKTTNLPDGYHIETLSQFDPALLCTLWDIKPSWQNDTHCILRAWHSIEGRAVYANDGSLVAYALLTPATGDIPQLAVRPDFRRRGIARVLMADLAIRTNVTNLRLANVDSAYAPFAGFAAQMGMLQGPKQYEMLLCW